MFVYWGKKEKLYRDVESVSSDFCENCNSTREHIYRLYEERRKHYSVLSGPTKRSVRVICQACKGESKPEKKHEKELIAKFMARIRLAEGFELMEQQNYDKALKKIDDSLKYVNKFQEALENFVHADFYSEHLRYCDILQTQVAYGAAICYLEVGKKQKNKKRQDSDFLVAKKSIEALMRAAQIDPGVEDMLQELRNIYLRNHDFVEFINDEVARERALASAELMQQTTLENSKLNVEDIKKIKKAQLKKAKGEHVRGTMPLGWNPEE